MNAEETTKMFLDFADSYPDDSPSLEELDYFLSLSPKEIKTLVCDLSHGPQERKEEESWKVAMFIAKEMRAGRLRFVDTKAA